MIIEKTDSSANNGLGISKNVVREPESRCPIISISRKSLLNSYGILRGKNVDGRQANTRQRITKRDRINRLSELHIVSNPVIQCQPVRSLPCILSKECDGLIFDSAYRISESLEVERGKPQAVGLDRRESGSGSREAQVRCREITKIVESGKIKLKDC